MWSKNKRGLLFLLLLVLSLSVIAVPAIPSALSADGPEGHQTAPLNPAFVEYLQLQQNAVKAQQVAMQTGTAVTLEPDYGYIPPTVDLSHIESLRKQSNLDMQADGVYALPSSFSWTSPTNRVTPVKNQNPCGTCWTFGNTSVMESRVWISGGASNQDYSEQALNCCTDPCWTTLAANRCYAGGNDKKAQDTFIKKGARLETCQPYNTSTIGDGITPPQACLTCTPAYMTTNFVTVATTDTTEAAKDAIKTAIQTYGPVTVAYYTNNAYYSSVDGYGYKYYYTGSSGANHLVNIVGWNDAVPHPADGGTGAWLVKNSWGSGVLNSGYFWMCYGKAMAGEFGSLRAVKAYNSAEKLYYLDEAGWIGNTGWGDTSAWMANIFTASPAGSLTHVDFYTGGVSTQYEIRVYKSGTITALGTAVATQTGTCGNAPGYYSIPLSTPVALSNGQAFTVAVKVTTPGYTTPIPIESAIPGCSPAIQTGRSYEKHLEGNSWTDAGATWSENVCLRARVTSGGTTTHMTPVSGNWNGTGGTEIGAYLNGTWYLDYNGNGAWNGAVTDRQYSYGTTSMTPVTGDWNGDGRTEIGAYYNGTWYLDYNGNGAWNGAVTDRQYSFGTASMTPVTGNWNGVGGTEIGAYYNGTWYLDYNGNGAWNGAVTDRQYSFGTASMTPVTGGSAIGAYYNGTWYLDYNGNGHWDGPVTDRQYSFGTASMTPVTGNWDGVGGTEIGAYCNGTWYLDYNGSGAWNGAVTDRLYSFGN
ncbi:MAG: lectin like domain-containing protein [Dehalococcoidia bacterium]